MKLFEFEFEKANEKLLKLGIHENEFRYDYKKLTKTLNEFCNNGEEEEYYGLLRDISKDDFFFFSYFVLGLPIAHPFLLARFYAVQDDVDGTLDLWARTHWKSTSLTFARTIWDLTLDQNIRCCIFSHTRKMAKDHLRVIKHALESNEILQKTFPDIFFENPKKDSLKWAEDIGLYVKRTVVLKEPSVYASGLIDGIPTGFHFTHLIFDDIIDMKNVQTVAQMKKAFDMFVNAQFLLESDGKQRVIGTRYHANDVYGKLQKSGEWNVRVFPASVGDDGKAKIDGIPVYRSKEDLEKMLSLSGDYAYSAQMLLDPSAASEQNFKLAWIRYYDKPPSVLNYYLLVDPASSKKTSSDYTVMAVIGIDFLRNYYLIECIRDRLSLTEKWEKLIYLVEKYRIRDVGYEQYGAMADIEYLNEMQLKNNLFFNLITLKGNLAKTDRIRRLIPVFQNGRFFLPKAMIYVDLLGETSDIVQGFLEEEYTRFPFGKHDDLLDCFARVLDGSMKVIAPTSLGDIKQKKKEYNPLDSDKNTGATWMSI